MENIGLSLEKVKENDETAKIKNPEMGGSLEAGKVR